MTLVIGTDPAGPGGEPAPLRPVRVRRGARMLRLPKSLKMRIGLGLAFVFTVFAVIGPWIAPYNPNTSVSTTIGIPQPPSAAHWLGTTQVQQDVLSQLLAGGRSTILVALIAGAVATMLAVVFGVTAGYYGGALDDFLSMLANIFLVMPALPLLIVIFGFLSKATSPNDVLIGLVISITGWAWGARVLRAQTLSMRQRDYVVSARVIGERGWRIMMFEILPNLVPIVATSFLFTVIYGVGTYTALSFLSVISVAHWSWGTMLYWAQSAQAAQQVHIEWWWFLPPGLAVGLFGSALALLNFGIDEFINPRLRAAGLSGRTARRAGLPRRTQLGLTPVLRPGPPEPAGVPAATGGLAGAAAAGRAADEDRLT
ncbi:MAG TPA: ABC transporter permease [Streptosporangiaceae bacterium]|nr:ABC transporter permease [Streptosporangiaceae bacterium]